MKKVMVAISGGVDSGVSALLLKEQGYVVSGMFMRHRYQRVAETETARISLEKWAKKSDLRVLSISAVGDVLQREWSIDNFPFPLPNDFTSALEVAAFLGVDLTLVDVDAPFARIVEDFVDSYYSARTPNPCVLCNRLIKFGLLWDVARQLGSEYFATGHYVEKPLVGDWLEEQEKRLRLKRERGEIESEFDKVPDWLKTDPNSTFIARSPSPKDQSYFLYRVKKEVLDHVIFPAGGFEKSRVREIAAERGLSVARRKDSQEICFVPDQERLDFIHRVRASQPERWRNVPENTSGDFLSMEGKVIGRHHGYEKYTIGQRKGLGIGFGERVFVQKIIPETKSVILGSYESLGVDEVRAVDSNWHVAPPINEPFRCLIKIRYRNETTPAAVTVFPDFSMVAKPDKPCYGVAPGQSLVCYWGNRLLGGGTIVR